MAGLDRKRAYFWLMGVCIALIVLAWNVVRFWSVTAAVVMSIVAAVIPPVAAVVGNYGALRDSEPGDYERPADGPGGGRRDGR
jgi:hypothetical protein